MTKLHISDELALPLSFVTSTQAILAKRRVGKSYTAQVQAEELLEANQQVIALDPTGAWYGLRSSPDGRSTGYPISIIGGKHGDAPLELDSGARWAEAIVADRFSAIFDLTLFDDVDWSKFIAEFLSTLYRLNEAAMHLFIDEADVACPQTAEDKAQQKALRAANNIVRRGGIKGIGCTLISQRPALINKSVLYMVDQLVVLQMNGELDLKQIRGWVKAHDLKDDVDEMIGSLPSLPKGDAWVWAPSNGIFQRVTIRRKHTFDSGRTPEPGEAHVAPKVLAPVDVKRLGKSIASAVERAAANDPAALRKRIAELEARGGGESAPRVVEKRIITDGRLRVARRDRTSNGRAVPRRSRFLDAAGRGRGARRGADRMTERGIIFSSDQNVRALLDGTKTQSRRALKVQPTVGPDGLLAHPDLPGLFAEHVFGHVYAQMAPCPYGVVGDQLWVREAFRSWEENHCGEQHDLDDDYRGCDDHCHQTYVAYRATPRVGFRPVPDRARIRYLAESSPIEGDRRVNGPWRSPLFLPRKWARITLEITEVRVQRLHEITADDARAEGCGSGELQDATINGELGRVAFFDPRTEFAHLWAAINGDGSWKANPWVWAITFKRVEEMCRG